MMPEEELNELRNQLQAQQAKKSPLALYSVTIVLPNRETVDIEDGMEYMDYKFIPRTVCRIELDEKDGKQFVKVYGKDIFGRIKRAGTWFKPDFLRYESYDSLMRN